MLFQHVPAKTRVFTAVGGAILNPQARLGDLPELPRNVGKNARFGPPCDRYGVVTRMIANGGI
jgi:hypothetical protein